MLQELNKKLIDALGFMASKCNGYAITDKGIVLQFKTPVNAGDIAARLGVEKYQVMDLCNNEYCVYDD